MFLIIQRHIPISIRHTFIPSNQDIFNMCAGCALWDYAPKRTCYYFIIKLNKFYHITWESHMTSRISVSRPSDIMEQVTQNTFLRIRVLFSLEAATIAVNTRAFIKYSDLF